MCRIKKFLTSALCVCLLATAFLCTPASVSAATTNLPPSILIGDENGIQVDPRGFFSPYYIDENGLEPGDVITKRITIQNVGGTRSENKESYFLTLCAEPLTVTGPVDLLDAVHLEIKLDGQVIYDGRCRGDEDVNMIDNPLNLGEYAVGDIRILDITFTVDSDMIQHNTASTAEFRWQFDARRATTTGSTPITGDIWGWLSIGGLLASCVVLVALKKRREHKEA